MPLNDNDLSNSNLNNSVFGFKESDKMPNFPIEEIENIDIGNSERPPNQFFIKGSSRASGLNKEKALSKRASIVFEGREFAK